jgi:secreted trypsin-like serine protease
MLKALIKFRPALTVMIVAAVGVALVFMSSSTAHAVANGTAVTPGTYLFSTKLTMTNIPRPDGTFDDSACSGALIAPQWIITAGHCFHDINGNRVSGTPPYPTTATLGRVDLTDTAGYLLDVIQVVQAPRVDVALAKLASAVTDIAPLPLSSTAPKVGAILRITGWGATTSIDPVPTTILQTGQVKVSRVTGSTLQVVGFAPAPDTSACLYDSGAPYFIERADGSVALVSIEKDGPDCPHTQAETTTRTDRLVDWIRSITAP